MPENGKRVHENHIEKNWPDPAPDTSQRAEPDWASTIQNLMSMAKEAIGSFEYARAIDHLNTLEQIWDSKGLPEFSLDLRLQLHEEKGKAYSSQGKLDKAIEEYQKILEFCRDSDQLEFKAETFTQIGQLLCKQGDHERALGYVQRATGAYRRLNNKVGMCKALRNLGVIYVELGEFEEAVITYEEAIDVAKDIEERVLYADLVNNLGAILNMRGHWKQALDHYQKSLAVYKEHDEVRKSAYTMNNVGITLADQGMSEEAFEYFREASETAWVIEDASLALIVDINLTDLYVKTGQLENAKEHCRRAEEYLLTSDLRNSHLIEIKKLAGSIARGEGDLKTALKYFNESYDLCKEIGTRFLEAEVLLERGTLLSAISRNLDALNDLEASYQIYCNVKAEGKREETVEIIGSIEKLYLEIFDSMGREVDHKDAYTKGHSDRVASLALLLAKELGLRGNVIKTIVAGALLHDIGKVKIDDAVLKKAGRLTDEEFDHIKKHPEFGVDLLRGKEFPWDVKPLILHHHEKIDGSGYPLGLKGEDIPLGARIIGIADVFDALTSDRVYRSAYSAEKALEIMFKDSGKMFDPVLLKCFMGMVSSGKADLVINAQTEAGEMYSIWSQCNTDTVEQESPTHANSF